MCIKVAIATRHEEANTSSRLSGLREQWLQKISDLIGGIPPRLAPLHEINHHINLIALGKQITYCLPKCPDALKAELADKVSQYTDAGWWVLATVQQAVLLRPITLAHNLLTNPVKNCTSAHSCSGSRVPEDPTQGLIPQPAPVLFGTSLTSSNFRFHCSMFQVFSVPSSIVTPVSCPLHVPCSTHTTIFVPSDPLHTIRSAQTIKVPCHVCSCNLNIDS